jgi:uncharacterized membrane protein
LGRDLEDRLREAEEQLARLTGRIYRVERLLDSQPLPEPPSAPVAVTPLPSYRSPQPVSVSTPDAQSNPAPPPPPRFGNVIPESIESSEPAATLESVIGGQWLNRLGVVAVLVGLSYFLKLAIENGWIGPLARVLIGLAAGVGLLFWSERFRRHGFAAFSYSLKALGLGALYLSLWASFQLYHLVPATSAFLGMILVTMAAGTLSIVQRSELLASLALLGGFLTPILISTNENREVSLLLYLLLLDIGAVWVVASRRWLRLLPGALAGTVLLFGGWAISYYSYDQLATTLLFATLFFLVFAITPLLTPSTSGEPRWAILECVILVLNAVLYFAALLGMMEERHRHWLALLTCALAAACIWLGRVLLKRRTRRDLETVYLVLAITFITCAVPLQFDGRWICVCWDIEAAVLFWLTRETGRLLLRWGGAIILGMSIVRLIAVDSTSETLPLFNPRCALYLLTIGAAALLAYLSLEAQHGESRIFAAAGSVACIVLALIALSLEVHDYFLPALRTADINSGRRSIETAEAFSYSALWMFYGAGLMLVGFWKRQPLVRWLALGLLAVTALKVFFVDISFLQRGYRITSFIALGIILLAVSFFYQRARPGTHPET